MFSSNDIFNNPFIEQAKKALSEKDKAKFARLGEKLYSGIDFETAGTGEVIPAFMNDTVRRIDTLIRSGLHISVLEDDEKKLMREIKGDTWYKIYGMTEADLTDVVNLYTS